MICINGFLHILIEFFNESVTTVIRTEKIESKSEQKDTLKRYFSRYLKEVKGHSDATVKHYFDALNNISRRLKNKNLVEKDIYEINELEKLDYIRYVLSIDSDFIELNNRGNNMYSAGLNNYYNFACGDAFFELGDRVFLLDIPIPIGNKIINELGTWQRSEIIRNQTIVYAEYTCELNQSHQSFLAEKNNKQYMEGHHIIPIRLQPQFKNSLDIYANIICLCPNCHRQIHYGLQNDRKQMMEQIYNKRDNRLANSGIKLCKQEFINLFEKSNNK